MLPDRIADRPAGQTRGDRRPPRSRVAASRSQAIEVGGGKAAEPHVLDAQDVPVQPSAAIRLPIQTPPTQAVPVPDFAAQALDENAPNSEFSPVMPSASWTRCRMPRVCSMMRW